ncbi:DUF159-domain-containing protein [Xylaria intraflava]|nr:DUF159-domain-containing protein [Xylaria intraflava]
MLRDDNIPVDEAPDDGGDEDNGGDGGLNKPRQSYNFAPGYRGVVYRADVPDWGAGPRSRRGGQASTDSTDETPSSYHNTDVDEHDKGMSQSQTSTDNAGVHYKLQAMKWGLIPFWTKRNPGYGSMMKTINCRDDSLAQRGGMWSSMKARKRCIVIAQGFYEWLKKDGGREKLPHYVKRKDGKLMCFAGLWDVVVYENDEEKQYTYTIITTDSNKQLNFLHDRMPVILDNGSEKMDKWLDPKRYEWSTELQSLLTPYDGELEVYPVSKDVGKVGNDSPAFVIPIDSKENKSNIANFFAKGTAKGGKRSVKEEPGLTGGEMKESQPDVQVNEDEGFVVEDSTESKIKREADADTTGSTSVGVKREADDEVPTGLEPRKRLSSAAKAQNPDVETKKEPSSQKEGGRRKISATSNHSSKSPAKGSKSSGTQKITRFFANSS